MNVVVLIADTVRWDILGSNGGLAQTPNLDALARRSTVFQRHYVASFPTVPARHDVLTGRPAFVDVGWGALPRSRPTLPQELSGCGFTTIGVVDTPFYLVNGYNYDRGFRHFYDVRRQPVGWMPRLPGGRGPWDGRYPEVDRVTGQLLRTPRVSETDYAAPTTFSTAEACLEAAHKAPFFLLVDTWDPHEPWEAPEHYLRRYVADLERPIVQPTYGMWEQQGIPREELERARGAYAAKLEMVDHWIGRLLAKIQVLGIQDRTAVVFTTDHGTYFGEHGIYGKMLQSHPGAGLWLRSPLYEEIAHIPLFIHVPGEQPQVVTALTTALDIAPTVLDLAGATDRKLGIGGISLAPFTRGDASEGHGSVITSLPLANPGDEQAVVDDFTRRVAEWQPMTLTTPEWSLLYARAAEPAELYRLGDDPRQMHDLAPDLPIVVDELIAELLGAHLGRFGVAERLLSPRRASAKHQSGRNVGSGSFFDRYPRFAQTSQVSPSLNRLGKRYQAIISPHRDKLEGATVLDIASHDGRWSLAAHDAGASLVTGIEARADLVAQATQTFRDYGVGEDEFRFVVGDVFDVLRRETIGADVVLLLGFFYHVARHVELVHLVERTGARHVIIDTAVVEDGRVRQDTPIVIELRTEPVDAQANQLIPDGPRGTDAIVGYPSRAAVRFLFHQFGFDCEEVDWRPLLADGHNEDLPDYLRGGRATFLATRRDGPSG